MKFEFDTAVPYLKDGGWLLSDDILWNNVYHEARAAQGAKPIIYPSLDMMRKDMTLRCAYSHAML